MGLPQQLTIFTSVMAILSSNFSGGRPWASNLMLRLFHFFSGKAMALGSTFQVGSQVMGGRSSVAFPEFGDHRRRYFPLAFL